MERVFNLSEIGEVVKEFLATVKESGVIGFSGNLGAGKTTFTKHLLEHFGHTGSVASPTFVLRRDYEINSSPLQGEVRRGRVIHIDAYRLENPAQIYQVISKQELADPKNLVIIEWPEKVDENIFDEIYLFEHVSANERRVTALK